MLNAILKYKPQSQTPMSPRLKSSPNPSASAPWPQKTHYIPARHISIQEFCSGPAEFPHLSLLEHVLSTGDIPVSVVNNPLELWILCTGCYHKHFSEGSEKQTTALLNEESINIKQLSWLYPISASIKSHYIHTSSYLCQWTCYLNLLSP